MRIDRFGTEILETNVCLQLLRSTEVGRLAVSITDHPDIFPVNYVVDHAAVVFRTAEGTSSPPPCPGTPSLSRSTATTRSAARPGAS